MTIEYRHNKTVDIVKLFRSFGFVLRICKSWITSRGWHGVDRRVFYFFRLTLLREFLSNDTEIGPSWRTSRGVKNIIDWSRKTKKWPADVVSKGFAYGRKENCSKTGEVRRLHEYKDDFHSRFNSVGPRGWEA